MKNTLHTVGLESQFERNMLNDRNVISSKCFFNIRYWRCDIKGAPSGKLQGKTVAIKDNTCVAGVPMMNGCRILDGFVPDIDATVVTRILDAGGHIVGKAVCENLCCDGGSFTAATGPVVNPHNKTRMAGGSSSGSAALVSKLCKTISRPAKIFENFLLVQVFRSMFFQTTTAYFY